MIYIIYLVLAALVIWTSIRLSFYVNVIDKRTNLSGAFIGGVMLAAVTSLPELFTSISSVVFINKPDLVIGNVLGSNLFNAAILGIIVIFGVKGFSNAFVAKSHKTVAVSTIVIYAILSVAVIFTTFTEQFRMLGISGFSIIILAIYIFNIKKMAGDQGASSDEGDDVDCNLTIKQVFIRFGLLSVFLVACSVAITYATDSIASRLGLGATVAGALFLGIATSLPEVTSSIALAKIGNYNATVGNIMGSNLFNFCILTLADIIYVKGIIYTSTPQSINLAVFGLISCIALTILLFVKIAKPKEAQPSKVTHLVYIIAGLFAMASYIAFIVLG